MEAQEDVMMVSKEHTHVVKGRRTKRQRPQSPMPLAMTTTNSSSGGEGGGGGGDCSVDGENDEYTNAILSPTTSNEFIDGTTDEEEDMANCLILLAQGQSPNIPKQIEEKIGIHKFRSQTDINGKIGGYCVYECKTCNRTFASFQALGGHRASHKKLKAMAEEKKQFVRASDEEEEHLTNNISASLSLQLGHGNLHSGNKLSKVHECSICGAEFTSGQALGGHMRRHRGGPMSTTTNTNSSLGSIIALEPKEAKKPTRGILSLDLNLPAPEDDHRESKFNFASKQQQQPQSPLLFSAPALVDCHY